MITIDVVLNCNHLLFKNYRKEFMEMETQGKHLTQIEQKLESLSALVLIFKKSLFHIWQEAASNRSKIYLFIQKLSQLKTLGLSTMSA